MYIKHVLYQVMTPRCYSERYPVGIGPRPIRKTLRAHFLISICKFATNIVDKWKAFQFLVMFVRTSFILDALVKSQFRCLFVLPAKTGIH